MRVIGIVALAAALAACQTQRPAQQAAVEDRPGCDADTPDILQAPETWDGGPQLINMAIEGCLGDGVYEGTAFDVAGRMWSLTYYHPDAPGAARLTVDGAPPKARVIDARGR